jgi:hypothetical protein
VLRHVQRVQEANEAWPIESLRLGGQELGDGVEPEVGIILCREFT